jgi:hypothetical protein
MSAIEHGAARFGGISRIRKDIEASSARGEDYQMSFTP